MSTPSGIIFDLDGTVYRGGQLIPGAGEAVAELRRRGHPIVFVTNALESPADCAAKLTRLGVPTRPDEVVTAPQVLVAYLRRHLPEATLFAISDPPLLETLGTHFR